MDFDRAFVISLSDCPTSAARLERFNARLISTNYSFRTPVLFRAIDGRKLPTPQQFSEGGGAFGCQRSHTRIVEDCLMDWLGTPDWQTKSVLVFEDDAVLDDDFGAKAQKFMEVVPSDWQGIYFGAQHRKPFTKVSDGVVKCNAVQRTHCYAARGEWLKALFQIWAMAPVHIDWQQEKIVAQYNVYAPDPFLVSQDAGKSFISGRDNPKYTWNNKPSDVLVVLRCPKEVMDGLRASGWHNGNWRQGGMDVGLQKAIKETEPMKMFSGLVNLCRLLTTEAASIDNGTPVIWHSEIPFELVKAASKLPSIEIKAQSVEQAQKALDEWRQQSRE